jgi:hypothetical protein
MDYSVKKGSKAAGQISPGHRIPTDRRFSSHCVEATTAAAMISQRLMARSVSGEAGRL